MMGICNILYTFFMECFFLKGLCKIPRNEAVCDLYLMPDWQRHIFCHK